MSVVLTATSGRITGTAASGRLRADGKIPATLYGAGIEAQNLTVVARDLRAVLHDDHKAIISIEVDGVTHRVVAQEIARAAMGTVTHVDFLTVAEA